MICKKMDGSLVKTVEPLEENKVSLRIIFDYRNRRDKASFFFRYGKDRWVQLGDTLEMEYTLDVFVGYRIGIFNYAGKNIGGYTDFKDFVMKSL